MSRCDIHYLQKFLAVAFLTSGKQTSKAFEILDSESLKKDKAANVIKAYYLFKMNKKEEANQLSSFMKSKYKEGTKSHDILKKLLKAISENSELELSENEAVAHFIKLTPPKGPELKPDPFAEFNTHANSVFSKQKIQSDSKFFLDIEDESITIKGQVVI